MGVFVVVAFFVFLCVFFVVLGLRLCFVINYIKLVLFVFLVEIVFEKLVGYGHMVFLGFTPPQTSTARVESRTPLICGGGVLVVFVCVGFLLFFGGGVVLCTHLK